MDKVAVESKWNGLWGTKTRRINLTRAGKTNTMFWKCSVIRAELNFTSDIGIITDLPTALRVTKL